MSEKIFVTYKYNDNAVYGHNKRVRDYVDDLQDMLGEQGHINKGEARADRTSRTNAVLAVVLPNTSGAYDYFIEDDTCPYCHLMKELTNMILVKR